MKILIVDDEEMIRDLLIAFLSNAGYSNCLVAIDGEDALEKIAASSEKFDLIISDVNMPKMNGYDMAKTLNGDSGAVLFIAGNIADKKLIEKLRDLPGCQDVLLKPVFRKEFLSKVKEILGEPS